MAGRKPLPLTLHAKTHGLHPGDLAHACKPGVHYRSVGALDVWHHSYTGVSILPERLSNL